MASERKPIAFGDMRGWMRALDSKTLADYQAELSAEASGHLAEMLRQRGFEIERRLEYRKDKKGTERPRVCAAPPCE